MFDEWKEPFFFSNYRFTHALYHVQDLLQRINFAVYILLTGTVCETYSTVCMNVGKDTNSARTQELK